MTSAVLYARVSSDDTGNDSRNIKGQLELCRNYAIERGYTIIAELHEDDRGASGAAFELPQLNVVREMARTHAFDVLVVREIDRLSRSLAKQLIVEEELRRAGVTIEYALASYDDTPEGRLSKHVRATIAEYEREKIRERTTRARQILVRDGGVMMHGRRCFGYELAWDGNKRTLQVVDSEAYWVRLIFQWYTVGDEYGKAMSMREIAARLTELRVPTYVDVQPNLHKLRARCEWPVASVSNILNNETYAGTWRYGRTSKKHDTIAVTVPAIVDLETFQAAQARRAENRETRRRAPKHNYLMGGRLRCSCGYAMGGKTGGSHKKHLYYDCGARTTSARVRVEKCCAHARRADWVDGAVWSWIKSLLTDEDQLTKGLRDYQARRESESAPLRERIATIDGMLADNRAQMAKILDLYLTGDFPREMLAERKGRLQDTITKLEAERNRIIGQLEARTLSEDDIDTLLRFVGKVSKGLAEAEKSFAERRRIIDLLDVRGVFVPEDGEEKLDAECVIDKKRLALLSMSS